MLKKAGLGGAVLLGGSLLGITTRDRANASSGGVDDYDPCIDHTGLALAAWAVMGAFVGCCRGLRELPLSA